MKTLVFSDSAELTSPIMHAIESLTESGQRITSVLPDQGVGSRWLAEKNIYYFLWDYVPPDEYYSLWKRLKNIFEKAAQTATFIESHKFDQLLIASNTESASIFRQAARLSGLRVISTDQDLKAQATAALTPTRKTSGSKYKSIKSVLIALSHSRRAISLQAYLSLKRLFDLTLSLALILLTSPILCALLISKRYEITRTKVIGIRNKTQTVYFLTNRPSTSNNHSFNFSFGWWLPALWSVLTGSLSLIGPRISRLSDVQQNKTSSQFYQLAPGLISRAQLKNDGNLNQQELDGLDQAYMLSCNPVLDLKILLLAISKAVRR